MNAGFVKAVNNWTSLVDACTLRSWRYGATLAIEIVNARRKKQKRDERERSKGKRWRKKETYREKENLTQRSW